MTTGTRMPANPSGFLGYLSAIKPFRRKKAHTYSVAELMLEAELVASYATQAGLLKDGALLQKLAAVNAVAVTDRTLTHPAVTDLLTEMSKSREAVPIAVVSELRNGWEPGQQGRSDWWMTLGFVVGSVVLMFAVGNLTLNYNLGTRLFAELVTLDKENPGLQFGRLERQLLQAQARLKGSAEQTRTPPPLEVASSAPTPEPPPASGPDGVLFDLGSAVLAENASYQYAYELAALDRKLRLYKERTDAFVARADRQLTLPDRVLGVISQFWTGARAKVCAWTSGQILCPVGDVVAEATTPEGISAAVEKLYARNGGTLDVGQVRNFCQDLPSIEDIRAREWKVVDQNERNLYLSRLRYLFSDMLGIRMTELMALNCSLNMTYFSQSLPDILDLQNKVSARLSTYSFLALPALYGALGSLMYFMRRILDPLLPNPKLTRIVHRVALGALAGMVLAWLWDGMFSENESFKTVGFGLFTLAFIFGFAIDVFFTLLDRLVKLATNGVARIGET